MKTDTFWKELVYVYKSLLPCLTFVNCEGIAKGFVHNLCFNIVFAQLEVIPRTKDKFVEIIAVAEHYFVITHHEMNS